MILSGKRILIVKPSSLGDVVHGLPVVHAIKRTYPSCYIGWIVQQGFRGVLESDPEIDEVIPISIPSTSDPLAPRGTFLRAARATVHTLRELRRRFKEKPYDLVIDLHASLRSGLLAMTNPGGIRIGFAEAKELNTWFQHRTVSGGEDQRHAVDKNLELASYLGCAVVPEDFRVVTSPGARECALRFLLEQGIDPNGRIVYANPVGKWETKLWTVEEWAKLGDLLIREARAAVILAGGPDDLPYLHAIRERMTERPAIAAGVLSLGEASALLELSPVYVGVDSGPMHIAAFVGTRVVALFGPTDPVKVGPYGEGHRVIRRADLSCLACRKRSCEDRRCLETIEARQVLEETLDVMAWR